MGQKKSKIESNDDKKKPTQESNQTLKNFWLLATSGYIRIESQKLDILLPNKLVNVILIFYKIDPTIYVSQDHSVPLLTPQNTAETDILLSSFHNASKISFDKIVQLWNIEKQEHIKKLSEMYLYTEPIDNICSIEWNCAGSKFRVFDSRTNMDIDHFLYDAKTWDTFIIIGDNKYYVLDPNLSWINLPDPVKTLKTRMNHSNKNRLDGESVFDIYFDLMFHPNDHSKIINDDIITFDLSHDIPLNDDDNDCAPNNENTNFNDTMINDDGWCFVETADELKKEHSNELEIINNEITKLCPKNMNEIKKDYKTMLKKRPWSYVDFLWPTITVNQSAKSTQLSMTDDLPQKSAQFLSDELNALKVPKEKQEEIRRIVENQIQIMMLTEEVATDVTERFHCDLSCNSGGKAYVGLITFGFVAINNDTQNMKFVVCGHYEQWNPSRFAAIDMKSLENTNCVKNYILYQMCEKIEKEMKKKSISL